MILVSHGMKRNGWWKGNLTVSILGSIVTVYIPLTKRSNTPIRFLSFSTVGVTQKYQTRKTHWHYAISLYPIPSQLSLMSSNLVYGYSWYAYVYYCYGLEITYCNYLHSYCNKPSLWNKHMAVHIKEVSI